MQSSEARITVERIRAEIEASRDLHIWRDYVNALKLIAQTIFTSSSSFILEFIQNAEDAGNLLAAPGQFKMHLDKDRLRISHNGRLFTGENVESLCGIRSSKKPERGTLGYLGIGFKSVFKVTDRPEIHSGGFHFKFDRNAWSDPESTPWHVIPIWLGETSEKVDDGETTFIIPFRDADQREVLLAELEKLSTDLYLFLHWMRHIVVHDAISGRSWSLENLGEIEKGITTLRHDASEQRFRIFRTTVQVPPEVKEDRLTHAYRAKVVHREIAIAFALDVDGNLAPQEAGAMYGGVYSFVPLGEAKSGAKFPIQVDFLVQPGRDAVNYEARWNHWLVEEVAKLAKEAIEFFMEHETWRYQFLPAFEFTKTPGNPPYEKLFLPKLIEPTEKLLHQQPTIPLADGGFGTLDQVVRLTEEPPAGQDLIAMGVLEHAEVASVLGDRSDRRLVHPLVLEPSPPKIPRVDRTNLLANSTFLEAKCQQENPGAWFRCLYLWLAKHPTFAGSGRNRRVRGYYDYEFVLGVDGRPHRGGSVWFTEIPTSDPILKEISRSMDSQERVLLHPGVLDTAKDLSERETIVGFLRGLAGVQLVDAKKVCEEFVFPKILTSSPKPDPDKLVETTTYCKGVLGSNIGPDKELWVLTKNGEVRAAKEVVFAQEFRPELDWETNRRYVPGLNFLSPSYVGDEDDDNELGIWRAFFKNGGVNTSPENGVEDFAVNLAMEKFSPQSRKITLVDKRDFGYDIEVENANGETARIEVKGLSHEGDIELTPNETEKADQYKDSFYLCVICPVPENPETYVLTNPVSVGKKDKVTISSATWKASRRM